jgi:hypothetical protein
VGEVFSKLKSIILSMKVLTAPIVELFVFISIPMIIGKRVKQYGIFQMLRRRM